MIFMIGGRTMVGQSIYQVPGTAIARSFARLILLVLLVPGTICKVLQGGCVHNSYLVQYCTVPGSLGKNENRVYYR